MSKDNILSTDIYNQVTIDELENIIKSCVEAIINNPEKSSLIPPILIHGAPGIGKSSLIKQICKDLNIGYAEARLAELQSFDIRGLPSVDNNEHVMKWNPPDFWPRDQKSKGILFFDELTSCARDCQVASYEIILDRKIGDFYKVPEGWYIVAAGNRLEDKAVATTMSSALANRFLHVQLREDEKAWIEWAQQNNINPTIIGYIGNKPNMLFNMKDENLQMGWPSPRSWEKVSYMIDIFGESNETTLMKTIYGLVGKVAGLDFFQYYKLNCDFGNVLDMMLGKIDIIIPKTSDKIWALCSVASYLLWRGKDEEDQRKRIDGFIKICLKLNSDFASMLMTSGLIGMDKTKRREYASALWKNPLYSEYEKVHGGNLRKRYVLD